MREGAGRWLVGFVALVMVGACERVEDVGPLLDELGGVQGQVREVVDRDLAVVMAELPAAEEAQDVAFQGFLDEFNRGTPESLEAAKEVQSEASRRAFQLRERGVALERVMDSIGSRHAGVSRRLREAYADGTWDLIADASPRAIVMGALREAQEELRRVEAGCSPLPQPGDDCVVEDE